KFLPQLDLADKCFSKVILPMGNIGVQDGGLTTRRADGSIVENYKEFWYGMVGLAGEGQNFDGNGNFIRFAVGGGSHVVKVGTSKQEKSGVIANANFEPTGASPLYPKTKPPYNLTAPCYRNPLPDVNGPQAGPAKAPPSELTPTPGALPDPTPAGTAT